MTTLSTFTSTVGGLLKYGPFLEQHLKPLDDIFGVDTWLRNTWAYSLVEYGNILSTIVFPFLSLILSYTLGCGLMFLLEYGPIGRYLESYKIQKVCCVEFYFFDIFLLFESIRNIIALH